jgi:hypothetical protein
MGLELQEFRGFTPWQQNSRGRSEDTGVECRPSGTDYSCNVEGDITEDRAVQSAQCSLTANSDRLSHFGHRMSLFLQTPNLRDILSSEQGHRQEGVGVGMTVWPTGRTRGEEADEIEIGNLHESGEAHSGLHVTGGNRNGCSRRKVLLPSIRQKREKRLKSVTPSGLKRVRRRT